MADGYISLKKNDKALECYMKVIDLNPEYSFVYHLLGIFYLYNIPGGKMKAA